MVLLCARVRTKVLDFNNTISKFGYNVTNRVVIDMAFKIYKKNIGPKSVSCRARLYSGEADLIAVERFQQSKQSTWFVFGVNKNGRFIVTRRD